MKLEKNGIVAIAFVVTFVILLLFSFLTPGSGFDLKGIFVAAYFAVWIAAATYVILTFIVPFVREKMQETRTKKAGTGSAAGIPPTPFRSPRSNLPVRDRIASYVAERRREDGLPTPVPLRPSKTGASQAGGLASAPRTAAATPVAAAMAPADGAGGDDLGDIPLPDDFGSVDDDSSAGMGSLPGLEDDLDDLGFGGSDEMGSDFGAEPGGFSDQIDEEIGDQPLSVPPDDLSDGGLPGFDGDLEPDMGESDLMQDDSMMDLSGDDILTIDDDTSSMPDSSGGLSDDGLPDLDGDLEPDILDSDLSGDDEFGDIEFMDLEPEEPKKAKK